jgi:N-acetylneuraminic acid mutarotase
VLVTGGFNTFGPAVSSAELYNPASNRWTRAASLRTPRYHHTATLLPDGRVLVVGGEQDQAGNLKLLSSAEIYDPARNRWTSAGRLPFGVANQTATLLGNGRVLIVGGGDRAPGFRAGAELYNPQRNRWSRVASLPAPRAFHIAELLPSGQVLVAGGFNDRGALASAWLYSPTRNRWRSAGSLTPAAKEAAVELADGRVLVAGGQRYQGAPVAATTIYTP